MASNPLDVDINEPLPIICLDGDDNIIDGAGLSLDLPRDYLQQNGITHSGSKNNNKSKTKNKSKNKHKNENSCQNGTDPASPKQQTLPKATYRQLQLAPYMKRTHTAASQRKTKDQVSLDTYYHYEEPTAEELLERVEYDMDLEDLEWLKDFNRRIGDKNKFRISEDDFEKIMDRLEKESYFENIQAHDTRSADKDVKCAVCNGGYSPNNNQIVLCELCELAVHQECYGVPYLPEGQWLCRRCLKSPMRNVECCLCPNLGGALKQTDNNKWAHVLCAMWVPEVCFANTVFLEPIDSIQKIPTERWKLRCYICNVKKRGACIQCSRSKCYSSFHVTCARQAGLYMKISHCDYNSPGGGTFSDVKKEAFCHKHGRAGGETMYSGDETDEDVDTERYYRKDKKREKQLSRARKRLVERREEQRDHNTAVVRVDDEKLVEISNLIGPRGKKVGSVSKFRLIKIEYVKKIHAYWQLKRDSRNGVPLLRRLQVSFSGHTIRPDSVQVDKDKYSSLRYDLETCRLLVGEMKRREALKLRLIRVSKQIIDLKLQAIDMEFEKQQEVSVKAE